MLSIFLYKLGRQFPFARIRYNQRMGEPALAANSPIFALLTWLFVVDYVEIINHFLPFGFKVEIRRGGVV